MHCLQRFQTQSGLISIIDGIEFRDLNKNGKMDPYEDIQAAYRYQDKRSAAANDD